MPAPVPVPGKRTSSKSSSSSSSSSSLVSVYFIVVVALFVLFGLYYWFKVRSASNQKRKSQISRKDVLGIPDTTHRETVETVTVVPGDRTTVVPPEKALTTMYVPKDVGHRTGYQRVFITNKGLRVYETNEHGWPMPAGQTAQTAKAGLVSQTPQ